MTTTGISSAGTRATGGRDLRLEVVRDPDAFDALRRDWDAAVAHDPDTNVFLTWAWTTTWWHHFGAGAEPHVAVLRDDQGIVAIAPLQRRTVGMGPVRASVLERISHDSGDYGGVVLVRRDAEAVAALVDHLAGQLHAGVSVVRLSRLASDARFTALLGDELARRSGALATVAEPLDEACLFTDVRSGFNLAKQAKKHKVRQRLRRLGEQHDDVAFVEHTGATLEAGLDRLVELHQARWDELGGEMQGLLAEPARQAFFLDAIRALDAEGAVKLLSIEAAGRAVAVELDFRLGARIFLFKGAFDPDFGAFSPGQLLHHRVFEDGLAEGVEVFDFCRGDALYKRRWANGERHLITLTLSRPGVAGHLARAGHRGARALARRWAARP